MSSIISLTIRRDRVRAGRVGMNPHRNLPQPMLDLCALLPTKNFDRVAPILVLLNFFLWGFLKDRVYRNNPQTIGDLKENIHTEMQAIPVTTCHQVMKNFIRRLELCRERNGGHLEQLL